MPRTPIRPPPCRKAKSRRRGGRRCSTSRAPARLRRARTGSPCAIPTEPGRNTHRSPRSRLAARAPPLHIHRPWPPAAGSRRPATPGRPLPAASAPKRPPPSWPTVPHTTAAGPKHVIPIPVDVVLEPRHEHLHHRYAYIVAGEIDHGDFADTGRAQPSEQVVEIGIEGRPLGAGHRGERTYSATGVIGIWQLAPRHPLQCPEPLGEQVVAAAGDVSETALDGFGQRSQQCYLPARVAAVSAEWPAGANALGGGRIEQRSRKHRNADVGGAIPNSYDDARLVQGSEHLYAAPVLHRVEIDPAFRLLGTVQTVVKGDRIALDHLAEPVQDSLEDMVSGGEPVRRLSKGRVLNQRTGEVAADRFPGNPFRLVHYQVARRHPADRTRAERIFSGAAVQAGHVDCRTLAAELVEGVEASYRLEPLGMPGLDRLHQRGGLRGVEVDPLALSGREATRRGADRDDDRNPDVIQSGDIGQAGYAQAWHQRLVRGERLSRRAAAAGGVGERFPDRGTLPPCPGHPSKTIRDRHAEGLGRRRPGRLRGRRRASRGGWHRHHLALALTNRSRAPRAGTTTRRRTRRRASLLACPRHGPPGARDGAGLAGLA